jgi:hypothetical protein
MLSGLFAGCARNDRGLEGPGPGSLQGSEDSSTLLPETIQLQRTGRTTVLARRSVLIRLDANVERPAERKGFRHPNLLAYARGNRGQLVWACLTLIQAWVAAGRPSGSENLAS